MWYMAAMGFGNMGQGISPVTISTIVQPMDQTSASTQPSNVPAIWPLMTSGAIHRGVPLRPDSTDLSSPSVPMRFDAPKSASFATWTTDAGDAQCSSKLGAPPGLRQLQTSRSRAAGAESRMFAPLMSRCATPCACINALTFAVVRRGAALQGLGAVLLGDARAEQALCHALFAVATLVFWLTLYCLWARRGPILDRGFDLSFVALTFPSCSTAIAGLQYASPPDRAGSSGASGPLLLALRAYAFAVAGAVAVTVVVVALGCAKIAAGEARRRSRPRKPTVT